MRHCRKWILVHGEPKMKKDGVAAEPSPHDAAMIGAGRLGQALGRALSRSGVRVRFVAARNLARARRAARFIGCGRAIGLGDRQIGGAAVIVLAVSDGAVAAVAEALARLREDWSGRVVLHTCGSLGVNVLQPLRRRGAVVGSLHPFQTIPTPSAGTRSLRGCYWGVDGDRKARAVAEDWVGRLGGKSFRVPTKHKALYHLSAFLVCPTTVTLMDQSERLLRRAGIPARLIRSMLAQFVAETARNFAALGGKKALTGPVARGDWMTVKKHLKALKGASPQALDAYWALAHLMAELTGKPIPDIRLER
jgi:predicted short-subunit dehydrogenase-like oxidoreductase (DUF2520 family)